MKYKNELINQIKAELEFQHRENNKGDENYLKASEHHTQFVEKLNEDAQKYPHFVDQILDRHIEKEEEIFGVDTTQYDLTQEEKGRIYSLVRCKHMKRIASELCQ